MLVSGVVVRECPRCGRDLFDGETTIVERQRDGRAVKVACERCASHSWNYDSRTARYSHIAPGYSVRRFFRVGR